MLKAKDIAKLTKEEALKKRNELERSLLELEVGSQKKKPVRKSIARLNTYLHSLELKKPVEKEIKRVAAPKIATKKN